MITEESRTTRRIKYVRAYHFRVTCLRNEARNATAAVTPVW